MGHVFVSYSRHDKERVDLIVEALTEAGIEVWIDRTDIEAGHTWREQIVEAIETCEAFILMLSPSSVLSDNVRREIDLAVDSKQMIFPLRLEPVELSRQVRYQLAGLQFIDVQQLGFEESLKRLLNSVKKKLANAPVQKLVIRQTEIVLQGFNPANFGEEKQAQLLAFVADLCKVDPASLAIAGTAPGSVHVFLNMPAKGAYRLKTMALNREKRLKQFGITSLRLIGDSKFINIALGILTTSATIGALHFLWLSLPSIFPSLFGAAAVKVIVVTGVIAATAAVGVGVARTVNRPAPPSPTVTFTITASLLPTQTPFLPATGPTQASSFTPTEVPTDTPSFTPLPTFTPTPTDTPTSTYTPTAIPTPTATETATQIPTDTPSPTATPFAPALKCSSCGFNVWNVQLNGSGNSTVATAGSSVTVSMDYQVWNTSGCPGCLDQIVIGLDATPLYCAYDGGPGTFPGQSGSYTNTITAPITSGTYTIYAEAVQFFTCSGAFAGYPPPVNAIGTIIVP